MEKSVQHSTGRERMIPLILLFVGLVCASWLSIQPDRYEMNQSHDNGIASDNVVVSDTTVKGENSFHYKSTKHVDGHEESVEIHESFGNDFDFHAVPRFDEVTEPPFPPMPDFEAFEAAMAEFPDVPEFPAPFEFSALSGFSAVGFDTVPHGQWEEFSRTFEENFKNQFGEFYQQHEEELKKMLQQVETQVGASEGMIAKMEAIADRQAQLAELQIRKIEKQRAISGTAILEERTREAAVAHEDMARKMNDDARALRQEEMNLKRLEIKLKQLEVRHKEVMDRIEKELVKDGYLKSGEKLDNIDADDKRIEVNGKTIKRADEKKYRKMMEDFKVFDADVRRE